jgi:hypothetical protein
VLILNAAQIRTAAPIPRVIDRLRQVFCAEYVVPARQTVPVPGFQAVSIRVATIGQTNLIVVAASPGSDVLSS